MPNVNYPREFLRGISNKDQINEKGVPVSQLFSFEHVDKDGDPNELKESINWHDNRGAIQELLNRKKDEGFQFKEGVAIFNRAKLDKNQRFYQDDFHYERKIENGNVFHGNLVIKKNLEYPKKIFN